MKKKTIIISILFLICLISVICITKFEIKRIAFFKESEIVNGQLAQETKVADLSNKMGIKLDSEIEKHKALIDRYDDIIINETELVNGCFVLKNDNVNKSNTSPNAIKIYVGSEETPQFYMNFALIHSLHEKGIFETVFQIKWKKSPLLINQKIIRVSTSNMAWDVEKINSNELLMYYEGAKSWITKSEEAPYVFWVDYYPDFITPIQGGKKPALNTMLQVWGTCFYTTKNITGDLRAEINFSFLKNQKGKTSYECRIHWRASSVFNEYVNEDQ